MSAAASAQGAAWVVVGAAARDLLLHHVFGELTTRATRDVDVTVLVEDWESFDALKDRLVASGPFSRAPGSAHRLLYGPAEAPLDLVPFGGVEDPAGTIAWPPGRAVLMSVVGFREAARSAREVAIAADLTVPVVALAALALLKVAAWLDRHHETDRDAVDLLLLRGATLPRATRIGCTTRRRICSARADSIPNSRARACSAAMLRFAGQTWRGACSSE